ALEAVVELDVLRAGQPRRTGGPAIDPRGGDRVPELSVGGLVPRDDTRPARIVGDRGRCGFRGFGGRRDHGLQASCWVRSSKPPIPVSRTPVLAFKSESRAGSAKTDLKARDGVWARGRSPMFGTHSEKEPDMTTTPEILRFGYGDTALGTLLVAQSSRGVAALF